MTEYKEGFTADPELVHPMVRKADIVIGEWPVAWEKFRLEVVEAVINYAQKDPLSETARQRIEFSQKEKEFLYVLGHHLYLINGMTDGGRANFYLARKMFGYAVAEMECGHLLGIDMTQPVNEGEYKLISANIRRTFQEQRYLQDILKIKNSISEYEDIQIAREFVTFRLKKSPGDQFSKAEAGMYVLAKNMAYGAGLKTVVQEPGSLSIAEFELTALDFRYGEELLDPDLISAIKKRRAWANLQTLTADCFMQGALPDCFDMASAELNRLAGGRNYGNRWKLGSEGLLCKFYPAFDIAVIGGESANCKGVRSFAERAVRDQDLFVEAGDWAERLGGEGNTNIQTELLEHPKHFQAALRERLVAIDTIVRSRYQPAEAFLERVRGKMREVTDVVRSRIVVADGRLDEVCDRFIRSGNSEAYLVLSRRKEAKLERTEVENRVYKLAGITDGHGNIEKVIRDWEVETQQMGDERAFMAVHDNRVIDGVPCQMEISTASQMVTNVADRRFYYGWQ